MNSREIALNIVSRVLDEGAYSNLALSKELNETNLDDKDRALVTELVYGTIRRKNTLDTIISNFVKDIKLMDKKVLNILRIAIYQMHFLDKVPEFAACNEAVELAKSISEQNGKLVNGILRSYTKNPDDIEVSNGVIDRLAYQYSYEPWFIRMIYKQYGEKDDWLIVRGQVYKKEEKEKYQILYLKKCSVYFQKDQQSQQNQQSQQSLIKESRMLIYDEKKNKIQIGNEVEAEGKLSFFETARNPGNFDQKAYYQRQNIHGKVWSETLRITDHTVKRIQNVLENIRVHCRNILLSEAGEKNGSILSAILLGEKSQMDPEIKKIYQVNGIGHILAISGLHLSVIGIGIYQLLRKLTGSYTIGGIGGIFFFFLYVLMIGVTVSVIRAGIMYLFRVGAEIMTV